MQITIINILSFFFALSLSLIMLMGATWLFYLAVMSLVKWKDNLNWLGKVYGYPFFVIGVLLDITFNIIVGSIMFLEFPRELLFTDRVTRHKRENNDSWRCRLAKWFCANMLDPFDPQGYHCGK